MGTKELKNTKAITLVALVITVIVLLILAGVALSLVLGEEGIIKRAITAGDEYDIAGAKEQVETLVASYASEYYEAKYIRGNTSAGNISEYIAEKLDTQSKVGDYDLTKISDKKYKLSKGTNVATGVISEDGTINWGKIWEKGTDSEGNQIVTDGITTLKVGDYVNYDPTKGATQTTVTSLGSDNGYGDQKFNLSTYKMSGYGWRVLGVNESGQIMLIADEFIGPDEGGYTGYSYLADRSFAESRTYYYLRGKTGYKNGIEELNKICSMYGQGQYATGARSITVEDINKVTGYNPETAKYGEGYVWEYGNKVTYSRNGTSTLSYSSKNGSGSNNESRFDWFDVESKSWKEFGSTATGSVELTSNYYWYNPNTLSTSGIGNAGISLDSTEYKMLFGSYSISQNDVAQRTFTGTGTPPSYWLGSSYVYCYSSGASFGLRTVYDGCVYFDHDLADSYGYEFDYYYGVLPVVSLQSDIQLKQSALSGEWNFVN